MKPRATCWILTPGLAAFRKQTAGIAQALDLCYEEKILKRPKPWCWLPKICSCYVKIPAPPWPDLVISCGASMIPFALAIRKASAHATKLIHLLNPHLPHRYFDVIIAPEHDRVSGVNVINTFGAIHDLTDEKLKQACDEFKPIFSAYPGPYLSIFIGGSTKKYTLTTARIAEFADTLIALAQHYKGTVLISASRRTGVEHINYLQQRFNAIKNIYFYAFHGANPYNALLALADTIMVTEDSISMISETLFTGKPVYLLKLPAYPQNKKHQRFIQAAIQRTYVRYFTGNLEHWSYPRLDEATRISRQLKELLYRDTHE